MRNLTLVTTFCIGCIPQSHLAPQVRTAKQADFATVQIEVSCGEDWPQVYAWTPDRLGTGVAISDYRILTAAHVVECPAIPKVHVTLANGRRFMARVERDDAMFGDGKDLARIYTLESMELGVAPPVLSDAGGSIIQGLVTHHGDSGRGVYDSEGRLLGLVSASGDDFTRIVRVDSSWL